MRSMWAPRFRKPLVDALVAAIDLADVPDRGRALGAERGDQHRHAGADVRARQTLAVETCRSGDHGPVRVAENDACSHRDELVDEEEPALEHLLEDENRSVRLCRGDDGDRREVGREGRPRAVLDLRNLPTEIVLDHELLPGRHAERRLPHLDPNPEALEGRQDGDQIARLDVLDREIASRRRGQADEAPDLDVLRPDTPRAAAELRHSLDAEDVRLDPFDLRAERDQKATEVLDMRLAGRIPDHRLALGEHRRHDHVLRGHHAGLVEEDGLAAKPSRAHLVAPVDRDLCPQLGQPVNVRVEAAAADHIASGRRHGDAAEAGQKRTCKQERRPDAAAELLVELGLVNVRRIDTNVVLGRQLDIRADVREQLDHRLDVADPRNVRQLYGLGGERTRRQDRQRAVLVARSANRPAEGSPALDQEGLHSGG